MKLIEILFQITQLPPQAPPQGMAALEDGRIVFAPSLSFDLSDGERRFLSPDCLDGKAKNVSLDPKTGIVRGASAEGADRDCLRQMLARFSSQAWELILGLCPGYRDRLQLGLTSYRPAEVAGRVSSWRKDDTRLHVDAFPSRPLQGKRILRVFANVGRNPRLWRTGESFEQVARRFLPRLDPPVPGSSWLLQTLHITRGRRTPYDHFMLGIHDAMKADEEYQNGFPHNEIAFPAGATWACYTDSVSHAALSGQFAFEQTFYLPVEGMLHQELAPLRILERLSGRPLI